jgi:dihydroorotase
MQVLVKQALICDLQAPHHGTRQDVLIENGIIRQVGKMDHQTADCVVSLPQLAVSPGWTDIFSFCGEPGYEYKETLQSLTAAAARGGYTAVFVLPNTQPATHNATSVTHILQKTAGLPVQVHPLGAVTINTDGKELAEMIDMYRHGVPAFSDGLHPVQNPALMVKALQYVKAIDAALIQLPIDKTLAGAGLMHESAISVGLGLPGSPAIAEELMVARDIELCRYTQSKLHITGISTARSADLIKKARGEGVNITCSVSPLHLHATDASLQTYNTNYKTNPPLRGSADRDALRRAVIENEIECLASHHLPHEKDSKDCEFEQAAVGCSALETAFYALASIPGITPLHIARMMAAEPRRIFGLEPATIAEGQPADLSFFSLEGEHIITEKEMLSRSKNNAFTGQALKGTIWGTIKGHHINMVSTNE